MEDTDPTILPLLPLIFPSTTFPFHFTPFFGNVSLKLYLLHTGDVKQGKGGSPAQGVQHRDVSIASLDFLLPPLEGHE